MRDTDTTLQLFIHAGRMAIPYILLLVLFLLGFISMPLPHMGAVKPYFVLMAIYYWSIYRPTLMPPYLCFFMGLAMDALSGGPLGLSAMILVMMQWTVRSQRRFLRGQPYVTAWAVFALILTLFAALQWALFGLIHMQWPTIMPVIGSVAMSLFLYPFLTLLFVAVHKILPVASHPLA